MPLSATDTYGSASRDLTVNIYEAPKIQSANSATFFTGMPATFVVTTTGYPVISSQPVTMNDLPPTDPTQGQGMHFTVTGLPSDLQYSNLNAQGQATGTLTIQGTPSTADAGLHRSRLRRRTVLEQQRSKRWRSTSSRSQGRLRLPALLATATTLARLREH